MYDTIKKMLRHLSVAVLILVTPSLLLGDLVGYSQVYANQWHTTNMLALTPDYTPANLRGITVQPDNPLQFSFILDEGHQAEVSDKHLEDLVKYFLAVVTIPQEDLWVNLSPYESDRIMPESLGQTVLGEQFLQQDYLLKKLSSSLTHPDTDLGQRYWDRVYSSLYEKYGTTELAVDTFHKVWITPKSATIYVDDNRAFLKDCQLQVMLEEDYLAQERALETVPALAERMQRDKQVTSEQVSEHIRNVIVPELEYEVNHGEHFAPLRQIYHSFVLALWFKNNLKNHVLNQVYTNQSKVEGLDLHDPQVQDKVYAQYTELFKQGVYDFIREDVDPATLEELPRRYFSGGVQLGIDYNMVTKIPTSSMVKSQLIRTITKPASFVANIVPIPRWAKSLSLTAMIGLVAHAGMASNHHEVNHSDLREYTDGHYVTEQVDPGETFGGIMNKYGISRADWSRVQKLSGIQNIDFIRAGGDVIILDSMITKTPVEEIATNVDLDSRDNDRVEESVSVQPVERSVDATTIDGEQPTMTVDDVWNNLSGDVEFHEIVYGDTLMKLVRQYFPEEYHDVPDVWQVIAYHEVNQGKIPNPNKLSIGQDVGVPLVVAIPVVTQNQDDANNDNNPEEVFKTRGFSKNVGSDDNTRSEKNDAEGSLDNEGQLDNEEDDNRSGMVTASSRTSIFEKQTLVGPGAFADVFTPDSSVVFSEDGIESPSTPVNNNQTPPWDPENINSLSFEEVLSHATAYFEDNKLIYPATPLEYREFMQASINAEFGGNVFSVVSENDLQQAFEEAKNNATGLIIDDTDFNNPNNLSADEIITDVVDRQIKGLVDDFFQVYTDHDFEFFKAVISTGVMQLHGSLIWTGFREKADEYYDDGIERFAAQQNELSNENTNNVVNLDGNDGVNGAGARGNTAGNSDGVDRGRFEPIGDFFMSPYGLVSVSGVFAGISLLGLMMGPHVKRRIQRKKIMDHVNETDGQRSSQGGTDSSQQPILNNAFSLEKSVESSNIQVDRRKEVLSHPDFIAWQNAFAPLRDKIQELYAMENALVYGISTPLTLVRLLSTSPKIMNSLVNYVSNYGRNGRDFDSRMYLNQFRDNVDRVSEYLDAPDQFTTNDKLDDVNQAIYYLSEFIDERHGQTLQSWRNLLIDDFERRVNDAVSEGLISAHGRDRRLTDKLIALIAEHDFFGIQVGSHWPSAMKSKLHSFRQKINNPSTRRTFIGDVLYNTKKGHRAGDWKDFILIVDAVANDVDSTILSPRITPLHRVWDIPPKNSDTRRVVNTLTRNQEAATINKAPALYVKLDESVAKVANNVTFVADTINQHSEDSDDLISSSRTAFRQAAGDVFYYLGLLEPYFSDVFYGKGYLDLYQYYQQSHRVLSLQYRIDPTADHEKALLNLELEFFNRYLNKRGRVLLDLLREKIYRQTQGDVFTLPAVRNTSVSNEDKYAEAIRKWRDEFRPRVTLAYDRMRLRTTLPSIIEEYNVYQQPDNIVPLLMEQFVSNPALYQEFLRERLRLIRASDPIAYRNTTSLINILDAIAVGERVLDNETLLLLNQYLPHLPQDVDTIMEQLAVWYDDVVDNEKNTIELEREVLKINETTILNVIDALSAYDVFNKMDTRGWPVEMVTLLELLKQSKRRTKWWQIINGYWFFWNGKTEVLPSNYELKISQREALTRILDYGFELIRAEIEPDYQISNKITPTTSSDPVSLSDLQTMIADFYDGEGYRKFDIESNDSTDLINGVGQHEESLLPTVIFEGSYADRYQSLRRRYEIDRVLSSNTIERRAAPVSMDIPSPGLQEPFAEAKTELVDFILDPNNPFLDMIAAADNNAIDRVNKDKKAKFVEAMRSSELESADSIESDDGAEVIYFDVELDEDAFVTEFRTSDQGVNTTDTDVTGGIDFNGVDQQEFLQYEVMTPDMILPSPTTTPLPFDSQFLGGFGVQILYRTPILNLSKELDGWVGDPVRDELALKEQS